MTRDEMIEKLTKAIPDALDALPWSASASDQYKAAATAVLDLCGPKPLSWVDAGTGLRTECGMYRIIETPGRSGYYRLLRAKYGTTYCGDFGGDNAEQAAKAAAQAHADAVHWENTKMGDL
jgi:hypothetical protein